MSLRNLRIILWGLVLVAGLGASWLFLGNRNATPVPTAATGESTVGQGDYRLATTTGEDFTENSLKGAPSLVFFGFTHCPDVCPTTMGEISLWKDQIGEKGQDLRVWFVTVDPERDTREVLTDYTSWLPGTVGVIGTEEETTKVLKAFSVFARKVPLEGGDYSMDHSAFVMLFGADGKFIRIFNYLEAPESVVPALRAALEGQA